MRLFQLLLMVCSVALLHSCSQSRRSQTNFDFGDLTFHSSRCNGSCPDISMNVYKDGRAELIRTLFTGKGVVDSAHSGTYKGKLSDAEMRNLLVQMKKVNWDSVVFPDITCCDLPVKTILLSFNGKQKKFKSMRPPEETAALIKYLTDLAVKVELPAYSSPIDFQEY